MRIGISYRHRSGGGEWKREDYPVYLDQTPCIYGGTRTWFRCPARGCGRRVAILYGGAIFACRHCYRPDWRKPKGMHQRTYERLVAEAEEWMALSVAGMIRQFGVGPEER